MGAIRPLKISIEIDVAGVIYDPYAPIMLDSLVDWCLSPMVRKNTHKQLQRDEAPDEIKLPLGTWHIGKHWGWSASALFPVAEPGEDEIMESVQYFRKRFRRAPVHLTKGKPNTQSGPARDFNIPFVIQHPAYLVGYAVGNAKVLRSLLKRNVRYIGKKRQRGKGRVLSITVEPIEEDRSVVWQGQAMRWLPDDNGLRLVRLRPPYWNIVNRVKCCEIGATYRIEANCKGETQ